MITITSYIIVNICIFIVCLFCPKIWNLTVIKICILPCPIESLLLKGLWAPVAQLDRVAPSEGVGRTFESSRVRHFLYLTLMFAALVNHSCYSLTAPMGRRTFADTPLGVQFVRAKNTSTCATPFKNPPSRLCRSLGFLVSIGEKFSGSLRSSFRLK